MTQVTEEFLLIANLQVARQQRAWIDAEFLLYQKLIEHRQKLLDVQLLQIKVAEKKLRKELRESTSRADE